MCRSSGGGQRISPCQNYQLCPPEEFVSFGNNIQFEDLLPKCPLLYNVHCLGHSYPRKIVQLDENELYSNALYVKLKFNVPNHIKHIMETNFIENK